VLLYPALDSSYEAIKASAFDWLASISPNPAPADADSAMH